MMYRMIKVPKGLHINYGAGWGYCLQHDGERDRIGENYPEPEQAVKEYLRTNKGVQLIDQRISVRPATRKWRPREIHTMNNRS